MPAWAQSSSLKHHMLWPTSLITADWLGWLTAQHQISCFSLKHAGWYQSRGNHVKTCPPPPINETSTPPPSSPFSPRGRGWEKQSVGWHGEDGGGMDRCCCQDLSAVTNGCGKDEASKTLENSDVVNHRYERVCVCACVFYVPVCVLYWL